MAALNHLTDWESSLKEVVRPSTTTVPIHTGAPGSPVSSSTATSSPGPTGATTPELSQNGQSSLEIVIQGGGVEIPSKPRTCAAWAVILASYSRATNTSIRVRSGNGLVTDVNINVQWNLQVRDLVEQVENTLGKVSSIPSSKAIGDSYAEQDFEDTFHVVLPAAVTQSGDLAFSWQAQGDHVHISTSGQHNLTSAICEHITSQFEYIIRQICSPDGHEKLLSDLKAIPIDDLNQVWSWNAQVPQPTTGVLIHRSFMARAAAHPDLPAVEAHDGQLTYRELDGLSTRLALALLQRGIEPRSTIIIFIEKSMWVPVAQLAVMKCGCASTVFDVTLPSQRHEAIACLVGASAVLTSPECEKQAETLQLDCVHLTLSPATSLSWPSPQSATLPEVADSDTLYICFTSGSTGTPKGAIISHSNYASAVALQQEGLDFREFDRVFDFASYAFDAAWCNLIHALMIGGCLCIPSDEERKSDLPGALRKYRVNYAVLTPSVAWFPASELPNSLRTIHFGGEPLKAAMVRELSAAATVINAYGPAECSTVSTAVVTDPEDEDDPTIGTGLGACTWVVRLDGSDLVAVGEIGELWMEGPIVGQGYLNEPEKTAASFVENPPWLLRGCPRSLGSGGSSGRRGRLYRSGDLVRYGADGSLQFVGRKDSQVKIRGQRVELGEIEYNLQQALTPEARSKNVQIVAEVLTPEGSNAAQLVSFVFVASNGAASSDDIRATLHQALIGIEDRLALLVPPYMIPSVFIPIDVVPMTPTGKVDRRQLRAMGSKLYWHPFGANSANSETDTGEVETESQAAIRQVWADVLNLPVEKIKLDAIFTRLGGDSISAMQVVSRCRDKQIFISVTDILKHQTIRKITQLASLTKRRKKPRANIIDENTPFPLTPIQQVFFDNNPEGVNHYSLSFIVKLVRHTTPDAMLTALVVLTERHSMLRARFRRRADGSDWEQYIAPPGPESFHLEHHDFQGSESMQLIVDSRQASLDLVNGPVFAVDVFESTGEPQTLLMSAHHVVMDLVSWRIIWHELSQFLSGRTQFPPLETSFQTWCRLQREEAERLQPAEALPFQITPANFEYWNTRPEELYFRDSELKVVDVGAEATSLLLGNSNNCFRAEIQDILLGTLIFCFSQTFPDRSPPTVFLEGHGREVIDGLDDLDLSEIVGWFTTLHPASLSNGADSSIFELIKFAKDTRKRMPLNGRPYFATRFYNEAAKAEFETHKRAEVIFNYRGSFQQLEDANSIFRLEDRQDRNLPIPGDGPEYRRPSLIDINLVIQEGSLQVWTRFHKPMRNSDGIIRWIDLYSKTLDKVAHELVSLPASPTVTDFPLLDVSDSGLKTLLKQMNEAEITDSSILDVYPCTPMQEGILISLSLDRATYRTVSIWEAFIDGQPVNTQRLQDAWNVLSHHHAVFSTIFTTNPDTGRFVQVVLSQPNAVLIVQAPEALSALEYLQQMPQSQTLPSRPECFFAICAGSKGDVACRLEMTHALMDALSIPVIVRDLEKAYIGQKLLLRSQFRDYIAELQGRAQETHLTYWKDYLSGVEPCNLPGDVSTGELSFRPNTIYGWVTVPASVTDSIAEICRENEITRSVFLHAAWSLVLAHFTGKRQVCFGYVASGRDLPVDGIEDLVGPLINMQIARVDVEKALASLLLDVKQYHVDQLDHQHVSLAEIQHEISSNKLFNTNITVRDARSNPPTTGPGLHLVEVSEEDPHEYDLVLSAALDRIHTEVRIQYRTDFVTSANAREIQDALENAITFLSSTIGPKTAADAGIQDSPLYDAYFDHTLRIDEASALAQWKAAFRDLDAACHFPSVVSAPSTSTVPASYSCVVTNPNWRDDYDVPSQIFAAWALLAASYGNSRDVVFGTQLRKDASSTPMRLVVDLDRTVCDHLSAVQSAVERHSALPILPAQRLREIDSDSALAWDFPTVLGIDKSVGGSLEHHRPEWGRAQKLSVLFSVTESEVKITSRYDESSISSAHVTSIFSQLETVLRQLWSPAYSSSRLGEIDTISGQEFRQIAAWNGARYDEVHCLIHDLISRTVNSMPDALAISAWNGELTYRQLDELSTRLAHYLVGLGVGPEVIVPVYSEKSCWVAVCVVGIMKAGGAGVMIDCNQPVERITGIFSQIEAKIALVSKTTAETASQYSDIQSIVVDKAFLEDLPDPEQGASLPSQVQSTSLLYISFTSGSTGRPKGAMVTHTHFASSIKHQQTALGFRASRRVYDFASYAFDAAWSNLLHTLTSGGCLCVPSEEERQNDLAKSIRDSRASLLNITPSVLRHLDPRDLPDIEQVLMGGEAWAEADFLDWIDNTRLINSYGPGECTIKSCLIRAYRGMVPNTIGYGIGLHTWIVRTDGSDRLAPVGAVGELWLEGPQVGRGYISDAEKTAAAFVTRPMWTQGIIRKPTWAQADGPPCRFYRTGDLVRYGANGTLVFQSRIDSQVKIRGQRTELGEIERGIHKAMLEANMKAQIVADVFKPLNSSNPILVAFLLPAQNENIQEKLLQVDQLLVNLVPSYMIPSAYISLKEFPMTATGKIHRKSLREIYVTKTLEEITALNTLQTSSDHSPPSTPSEKLLQSLWAEILKIDPNTIFADSSFLRIGGDSLGAMRLVALARKHGLVFTVAAIFKQPQLRAFAAAMEIQGGEAESPVVSTIEPFSLLDSTLGSHEEAKAQAASLCGIDAIYVEDVFPCTPLQAGLLAETIKHPGTYVLTESWSFKDNIDVQRFRASWEGVIQQNPILRTRIVDLPQYGLVQVVVNNDCFKSNVGVEAVEFGLGTPLMSFDISDSAFTWSIHHALYDGWTSPLIFNSLASIYKEEPSSAATQFQAFIDYLRKRPQAEADEFWRDQFRGFQAQNFPTLPSASYRPRCDMRLNHDVEIPVVHDGFTVATRITLAWAMLLATITNSLDASFGTTVSGRQADVPGIENMMGPTIATVPLRVTVDRSATVNTLLEAVQSQAVGMVPFEQSGLQHIRRLSEDCKMGCEFQSFLIVQPEGSRAGEEFFFSSSSMQDEIDHGDPFRQYVINLTVNLSPDRLGLQVFYDSSVVTPVQMRRLLDRFENIFRQVSLPENGTQPVSHLDTSSAGDLSQIWSWNNIEFPKHEQTIHGMFGQMVAAQPNAEAVCSWDGDFTYNELDQLSTAIAHELLQKAAFRDGGKPIVPLYVEKSKWTPVCQLAVMKAGGVSTLLDSELPQRRLEVIVELVTPEIIITLSKFESKARKLAPPNAEIIVIGDSRTWDTTTDSSSSSLLPTVRPDDWIYINFTSGSTGVPKGAIISHANFASAVKYGAKGMGFDKDTRTYDFTAYAFDVTWQNVLFTLCTGGCLCIPSQDEMLNSPVEAMARRRADSMHMIPSVSKLLHGANLKLVNFGGEKASRGEIDYWQKRGANVILTYGPAECTPTTTVHAAEPGNHRVVIGKGLGVRTWIIDPESGCKLSAIGDIGELWLEGPSVGQGYLKSPEKTKYSFVDDPEWLLRGCPGFLPGRTGRAYRTGDLVRYQEDGSIECIGRKDSQIKIRGQRVQLEEIEHYIFNAVKQAGVAQVVADIVKPKGAVDTALIAFIRLVDSKAVAAGTSEAFERARELATISRRGLATSVPSYMIPNGYIIVDAIPKTGSGKVDRNKLRETATSMQKEDVLQTEHIGKRAPKTPEERKLQALMAAVLSWDGEPFGMDNNFIQLGGDSISAMRLVSAARSEGLHLRVADILSKDSLLDLLDTASGSDVIADIGDSSFSLLATADVESFISDTILPQIEPGHGVLVDVLPVTDLQRIYLSDNLHTPRRSWFYSYVDFDETIDLDRLVQSCKQLVGVCDVYRTAFVRVGDTFHQAIFESWEPSIRIIEQIDDIEAALDKEVEAGLNSPVQLGAPLATFTLLRTQDSRARLVFGMSHAIYDGISRQRTLQLLADIYNELNPSVPSFRSFVLHTQSSKSNSYAYWRQLLQGSQMTIVPTAAVTGTGTSSSEGGSPVVIQGSVALPNQPYGITQASIFTLACTSTLSRITGSSDIVIGRTASGRASLPAGLQDVVGPCLNRVPIRVKYDSEQAKTRLNRLQDLQKQFTDSIEHETTGLLDIITHCTDWTPQTTSADFGCWIQYQNIDEYPLINIPGAVGRLQIKERWDVPVASDFLEILATPNKEGMLTVKIIAGPGYARETLDDLLQGICAEIRDAE